VSRCSPFVVVLSEADRVVLEERVRGYTAPFAVVVRARIVLFDPPQKFRTNVSGVNYAARCPFRYSLWTSLGVL
jgi:hypothetical protein